MSTGLRNQRCQIYSYTDASTNGVPAASYAFSATRWGRITETSGKAVVVGAQIEHQANAVITLGAEASVGKNDVVVNAVTGTAYRVLAIHPRKMANEQELLAVTVDDDVLTLTGSPTP